MPDNVSLTVGGQIHEGWTAVTVVRSMEEPAGTFDLDLTDYWGETAPNRRSISPGERCTLAVGGDTVITGYVDSVKPAYDAEKHTVKVTGRDAAADILDCQNTIAPGAWKNLNLAQLASVLCAPFGIKVTRDTDVGRRFANFKAQEGETVYEALERAARQRAVLVMSDGLGGIVLTRAKSAGAVAAFKGVPNGNILAAGGHFDHSQRFSRYVAKGQDGGDDWKSPEAIAHGKGEAVDGAVTRHRPRVIVAEDLGDDVTLQDRAEWERNVHAGRARRAQITVQGWRTGGETGALLKPNTIVRLDDNWLNVHADMLVVSVNLTESDAGRICVLELAI
ncbi:MAG: hypothetical protein WD407_08635, partial [Rhodospirillales bacterium]